jgi:phosphomannomutase
MGRYHACFKAYDIRGKVPSELDTSLAYKIARAYADHTLAQTVCVGYDIRLSGQDLCDAFCAGLNDAGVDAVRLGMVGTEMVYFATASFGYDGGAMITASHNPPEYNGLKLVRAESRPISGDSGLDDIERRSFESKWERRGSGVTRDRSVYREFVQHLLALVDPGKLKPLRLLLDAGNGAAGVALESLLPELPVRAEKMNFRPDGTFPNGVPNPILPESRAGTERRLRQGPQVGADGDSAADKFDFGVAWDGDYDRCFFFDGEGNFIEGYYIVGLLARAYLEGNPGQTIVYDPRLYWNTLDIVERFGGRAAVCKSGHAFIKEKMRAENAIYGGEMSAHHYFRDHWYCDSGMIPLLLVSRLVSESGRSLGDLVGEMIRKYPCSGEINAEVEDVRAALVEVERRFSDGKIDRLDGLSVEFPEWRFNLRPSNTEPVIRLNVEARGNRDLVVEKTAEILEILRS